jgi:hypothetical protein
MSTVGSMPSSRITAMMSSAAILPLVPATTTITGLDASAATLDEFDKQAVRAGVSHRTIHGRWPEVAPEAGQHTVVTAHHIIYNIAAMEQFIGDLTKHAQARVVMEVTRTHPQSPLNDLWHHFHGLDRPIDRPAALLRTTTVARDARARSEPRQVARGEDGGCDSMRTTLICVVRMGGHLAPEWPRRRRLRQRAALPVRRLLR